MKQIELFEGENTSHAKRTRIENNYRRSDSKSGEYSPKLGKQLADRIHKYCRRHNINKAKFVEECINAQMDILERQDYESYTKEELIALLMEKEER